MALGYVVWRSNSLVPSVLVHFANNVLASGRVVAATMFRNVAGDIAYVANVFLGVRSVDVGDPRKPVLIDTFGTLFQNAGS